MSRQKENERKKTTDRSWNKEEDKKNIKEWRRDKENKNKEDDRRNGGKSGGLPSNF